MSDTATPPDPVTALKEIARLLERGGGEVRKAVAFRRAAEALLALDPAQRAARDRDRSWSDLPGIGATTARVIAQASDGLVPDYLADMRAAAADFEAEAGPLLRALRGDLHAHTDASDGYAPLADMVAAARDLGHEYLAVTDHSPHLTVARGRTRDMAPGESHR